MSAFSRLKRGSFAGIEFPVRKCSVRGSLRYHVHEYSHANGGSIEKLGRKLYEIRMSSPMMATLARYPGLWPTRWNQLRQKFEKGETQPLHIPTIGTIDALCTEWPEDMDARIQSGVMVELSFLEDATNLLLATGGIEQTKANFAATLPAYKEAIRKSVYKDDIFDKITAAANGVFAIKDQVKLYGAIAEAKIRSLDALLHEADQTVLWLNDCQNWPVVNAMRDLAASNMQLLKDLAGMGQEMRSYTVPHVMSVSDISSALYGDNSHAIEIMQMNGSIEDAFEVRSGTVVRYYPAT